jgi:spore coat polysaccharide biosynthesis protein SpsF
MVAIIQARTASTRLPGKVLTPIGGLPLLAHVVARAEAMAGLDLVMVATSTSAGDDEIERLCADYGWHCFRGSEDDVLRRYADAARSIGAEHIMRITADCPLVCPIEGQRVIERHLGDAADFTHNVTVWGSGMPLGTGVELFTRATLERSDAEGHEPHHREHVDEWASDHRHELRFECVEAPTELNRPELRLTIDTAEDLLLLRAVHHELRLPPSQILLGDVVVLFDRRPELKEINAHVRQKTV